MVKIRSIVLITLMLTSIHCVAKDILFKFNGNNNYQATAQNQGELQLKATFIKDGITNSVEISKNNNRATNIPTNSTLKMIEWRLSNSPNQEWKRCKFYRGEMSVNYIDQLTVSFNVDSQANPPQYGCVITLE